jgi:hypothetical protein
MRSMTQFLATALLGAMVMAALPARAADVPPEPKSEKWCKNHPNKCERMKAERAAYCAKNPTTCDVRADRRDARRDACSENPEKCQQMRDERQQRREDRQDYCKENPDACDARKEQMRERQDERIERRREAVDSKGSN